MVMEQRKPRTLRNASKPILPQHQQQQKNDNDNDTSTNIERNINSQHQRSNSNSNSKTKNVLYTTNINIRQYILDPTKRLKIILFLIVTLGLLLFQNKRSKITNKQLVIIQKNINESKNKKQQQKLKHNVVSTTATSTKIIETATNNVGNDKLHNDKKFDIDPVNYVGDGGDGGDDDDDDEEEETSPDYNDSKPDYKDYYESTDDDNNKKDEEKSIIITKVKEKDTMLKKNVDSNTTTTTIHSHEEDEKDKHSIKSNMNTKNNNNICTFRKYPNRRYYGFNNTTTSTTTTIPDFLINTPYIFGKYPIILKKYNTISKICINTTTWEQNNKKEKFSDGQNPSLVHINKYNKKHLLIYNQLSKLLDNDNNNNNDIAFAAVITIGDSQCTWKNTDTEINEYNLSLHTKPPSIRTLFIILNTNYETIYQSTLYVHADVGNNNNKWGNRKVGGDGYTIQQLDDARIFWFKEQLYVSYRNGKHFGYSSQVHNPMHINTWGKNDDNIYIKVEESVKLDGGRNFAMFESLPHTNSSSSTSSSELFALTWVDPVTVVKVNMDNINNQLNPPRITKDRSTIHGTNGMLVPIKINDDEYELLGIAHFHRPEDRQTSDYARHGHHYTHAFYTISSKFPYELLRLSQEFLFPSFLYPNDGDLIQFASGIDIINNDEDNNNTTTTTTTKKKKFVISYGINDCEGAIIELDYNYVIDMLGDAFSVIDGNNDHHEVINFMKNFATM